MVGAWHSSIVDTHLASDVFGALALTALFLSSLSIERRTILLIQSAGSQPSACTFCCSAPARPHSPAPFPSSSSQLLP